MWKLASRYLLSSLWNCLITIETFYFIHAPVEYWGNNNLERPDICSRLVDSLSSRHFINEHGNVSFHCDELINNIVVGRTTLHCTLLLFYLIYQYTRPILNLILLLITLLLRNTSLVLYILARYTGRLFTLFIQKADLALMVCLTNKMDTKQHHHHHRRNPHLLADVAEVTPNKKAKVTKRGTRSE
jgi:hypothetical protein